MSGERCLDCRNWGEEGCSKQDGCELFDKLKVTEDSVVKKDIWGEALKIRRVLNDDGQNKTEG